MFKISRFHEEENGNGLMLCIFVLFVLFAVGGLVVDMGILYRTKGEMRKAANAAVLSGAQQMFVNDDSVTNEVNYILQAHNEKSSLQSLQIKHDGENKVTVTLKKNGPTYFMRIFSINSVPIQVSSSAKLFPVSAVTGAMPLGISMESIGLGENMEIEEDMEWKSFTLKTNPSETNYGKYGIISFNKSDSEEDAKKVPGIKPYKEYLQSGYPGEVNVGDTLFAQSGSVAADDKIMEDKIKNSIYQGKTLEDIKEFYINSTLDYTDSRIMLIIVYKEGSIINAENNIREVTVAGFAYFYIDNYAKIGNEREIQGFFIPKIYNSISNANALNMGQYTIKLVE